MKIMRFNQYFENQSYTQEEFLVKRYEEQVNAQKEIVEREQKSLEELLQEMGFETTSSPVVHVSDFDLSVVTQILKMPIEILCEVKFKKFDDLSDPTFKYTIIDKGHHTKWWSKSEFFPNNRDNQIYFVKKLIEYIS